MKKDSYATNNKKKQKRVKVQLTQTNKLIGPN